jgi:UDP-MurNAc hydroxylase
VIDSEIRTGLAQFIQTHSSTLFTHHCQWQVIYQLTVVFPDGYRSWYLDFSQPQVPIIEERNSLSNYFSYITASSFYNLIQKLRDWDYLSCSGEYRQFHKVYQVHTTGLHRLPDGKIADPLQLKYSSQSIAGGNIKAELATIKAHTSLSTASLAVASDSVANRPDVVPPDMANQSLMLNLGNVLIKVKRDRQPISSTN